jgi:arsenate reductase
MAEGWALKLKPGVIEPYSAGTDPHGLNPLAVKVMQEVGVDISHQTSKHVDSFTDHKFDYVITVCDSARETCPVFPSDAKLVHVGFDDPPRLAARAKSEEEALSHYRRVRDEIKDFIQTLPEAL